MIFTDLIVTSRPRKQKGCFLVAMMLVTLGLMQSKAAPAQEDAVLPSGVTLPAKGGMYAMEVKDTASALIQLHASEISTNSHAGSNFARSVVYAGPHAGWELKGLNASIHLRGAGLSFLIRLPDEDSELMRGRLTLLRLRQTDRNRVASEYSRNIFGGQQKRQQEVIEVTKTDVPGANWVKLTPVKPLEPGEYGIVVLPKDANVFSDAVYDFDVDFDAAKEASRAEKK